MVVRLKYYIMIVIFILCVILLGLLSKKNKEAIIIDKEHSYFHDFKIYNGKVYMYCTITLENITDNNLSFSIFAESYKDKVNGLITNERMKGYEWEIDEKTRDMKVTDKKIFFINRKQKISELKIVFIGEHGSGNMKDNRNLPDIYIVINK
ncbi:hypothetical protein EHW90_10050 [Lachnoanaerobaculum orale]|jgi:hypothetical protein|uniref:DUF4352 domain-containing protein n=1 Tax=Lachnoanaerobaculum orale TaxID=979627 RepID=A0A3P3Q7T8_9FIRM|nr:hypothetical protein [Lachnoanaerobaculum orale]RRJ17292.1 hypothetical protein EHW90_10050 [Lachnoanaerobaculum orale]